MEEFEMFEKLMRKFGYAKVPEDLQLVAALVASAHANNKDMFIDNLVRKKQQKIYTKANGKKAELVYTLRWEK